MLFKIFKNNDIHIALSPLLWRGAGGEASLILLFLTFNLSFSQPYTPDNGNRTYTNPVIYADYSDPDVICVNDTFYLVSSSFNCIPALPLLQSIDLVNWTIIGHVATHLDPLQFFSIPQNGNGVWAPSIRFHKNEFYIYYGDPDFGIYMTKSTKIKGPWSEPILVMEGKGLIDPSPLWDDDGNTYLVHAWAGSRAGIKSILTINKMNSEGTKVIDNGILIYDGNTNNPTIEGPKIYKRNGYYYILAPAGGVKTGWQLALRSKNIYGPYEEKVVLHQGNTNINGPHQGAWVETSKNESWFVHFQDLEAYGRVVLLQPLKWENDWPLIGIDNNNDGIGEPVSNYKKPNVERNSKIFSPLSSDEFNSLEIGLQWQWNANPQINWYSTTNLGFLRLNAIKLPDSAANLWSAPNLLLQKFMAPEFSTISKLTLIGRNNGDKAGMLVMGTDYTYLSVAFDNNNYYLVQNVCLNADKYSQEISIDSLKLKSGEIYMKLKVSKNAQCDFQYSIDGTIFLSFGKQFFAKPGKWIGARVGIFCLETTKTNDAGTADFDFFRVER